MYPTIHNKFLKGLHITAGCPTERAFIIIIIITETHFYLVLVGYWITYVRVPIISKWGSGMRHLLVQQFE